MNKSRSLNAACAAVVCFFTMSTNAALIDNGYGLIYDDVLNITWAQPDTISRSWYDANFWASGLTLGGVSGWRLPYISVAAGTGPYGLPVDCNTATELACRDNELGYMFYQNLGGSFGSPILTSGDPDLALFPTLKSDAYWSGTYWSSSDAWAFYFNYGLEDLFPKNDLIYTWAVHAGNVHAVDSDGDGVIDSDDAFPLDPTESVDTDSDGIGNNADTDDDNDTIPDNLDQPPNRDPLMADWAVSAGFFHTCALDDSGMVCWGDNSSGQARVPALTNPVAVSASIYHTCALDDIGVVCWGDNLYGRTTVPALSNPVAVSAGLLHTCALDDSGVVCWGYNGDGQTTVPTLTNPVAVSAGNPHTCALDDSGVVCWGSTYGQPQPALSNPVAVSAGFIHTCALDDRGVVCWGDYSSGQTTVPALSNPVAVSAGGYHTCALDDTGVVCWGKNSSGQTTVPALTNPVAVSAGYSHTCALDDSGIVCWGDNTNGQTTVPVLRFDKDLDGALDSSDAFPLDPNESVDTDSDGTGNNADPDDDNDGMPDSYELTNLFNPLNASDANADADGDGYSNLSEYRAGSDPRDPASVPKVVPMPWLPLLLE